MNKFIITKISIFLLVTAILPACKSPGISAPVNSKQLNIIEITEDNVMSHNSDFRDYVIATGDKLNFTVWGLPEAFPSMSISIKDNPLNTRTVNSDGTLFFPYIGMMDVAGMTITEVRDVVTIRLKEEFVNPQVDVTVVGFNEKRNVYVVGEIISPLTFKVALEPLTLMDAIGKAKGLNPNTSNGGEVYVLRSLNSESKIYRLDLTKSDNFLLANKFYVEPQDVIFVGPSNITKWNRVVSQLFPFSSFLNQIDLINSRD
jgi:polysaccharide export outer membrane protein